MIDRYNRKIDYVRISVTDKCNLRCKYCMPEGGIVNMPHADILKFEEIYRICVALAELGITKVKLTGGEPLVRKDLVKLIAMIKSIEGIENISLTTNGVLLGAMAKELYMAGINSVNVSLDTLNSETFKNITRVDAFEKVISGIEAAVSENIKVKINCVLSEEFNVSDMYDVASMAKNQDIDVRFIELMPIGCGKDYTGVDNKKVLAMLEEKFGKAEKSLKAHGNGPAEYFEFKGFKGSIGFISPMSHQFCGSCNRIRLTADGKLKLCLHYNDNLWLRDKLREGIDDKELKLLIEDAIYMKPASHSFKEKESINADKNKMVQIGG